ncbi:MAG: hypothetical protein WD492_09690 [Alkalispirochaeta sp.]
MKNRNRNLLPRFRVPTARAVKIGMIVVLVVALAGCEDVMGLVGLGEEDEGEDPGSVTIEATGMERFDGLSLRARIVNDGQDVDTATALAEGSTMIDASGAPSFSLVDDAGDTWIGEGGANYSVRIYVDTDGSEDYEVYDYYSQSTDKVTIDGDQTLQASEFILNSPVGSSYYVSMSSSSTHAGDTLVVRIFEDSADPDTDNPVGLNAVEILSSGSAGGSAEYLYTDGLAWVGVEGTTYDAYIHIEDAGGNQKADSGESVYSSFPLGIDVGQNSSLSVSDGDFSTYSP